MHDKLFTILSLTVLTALSAAEPPVAPAAGIPPRIEKLPDGSSRLGPLRLHPDTRELSFPARIVLDNGVLECIIVTPSGRLHESLLEADVSPLQVQAMLYALDYNNGPRLTDAAGRRGDLLDILIEWTTPAGKTQRRRVEEWILDQRTSRALEPNGWVFVGSVIREGKFLAELEGNVAICYSVGATVLDTPDPQGTDDTIFVVGSTADLPGKGASVRVVLAPHKKP